jgi:hypothetical protein
MLIHRFIDAVDFNCIYQIGRETVDASGLCETGGT